jgi:hypothetical protein
MRIKAYTGTRPISLLTSFVVVAGLLTASAQDSVPPPELPDSPGAVVTEQKASSAGSQESSPAAQSTTSQSDSTREKPVGTAAAQKPAITGVAASDAAGAAIAPAKQKHGHSLLIRMGAIVGAGVAVGTVAALSNASPSRPPGSH